MDTRFSMPAARAASCTARFSILKPSGLIGLRPGNSQPPSRTIPCGLA